MSELTEEQKRRIEENRKKALEKRKLSPFKIRSNFNVSSKPSTTVNGKSAEESTSHRSAVDIEANRQRAIEKRQAKQSLLQGNQSTVDKIRPDRISPTKSKELVDNYMNNVIQKPSSSRNLSSVNVSTNESTLSAAKTVPRPNGDSAKEQVKAASFFGQKNKLTGSCVLVDRYRFKVTSDYCSPLIDIFKTLPTRSYDALSKDWSFKLEDYNKLMSKVSSISDAIQITGLPKTVQSVFGRHLRGNYSEERIPTADLSRIADQSMVDALMPFQLDGVNFGVSKNGRLLLADDMGLGKSLQAICLAAYYRSDWPLLIVCPSSMRFAWKDQFRRWMKTVPSDEIQVCVTTKDPCDQMVNIISYDLLTRKSDELLKRNFNFVIFDESHLLKSGKTARTRAALPISKRSRRVILLSGTPALSRPNELYTQIQAVDHKLFSNFQDFGVRYCAGKKMPWGWDFSGASNLEELQLLLCESIMIRRLKRDVIKQLPSKRREMVLLDPPTSSARDASFKSAEKNLCSKKKGAERHGALLQYFQETARVKVNAVKNYVLDLLEAGKKFLVFAHHGVMLDAIQTAVENKYDYIRIDGKVHPETRKLLCDRFQKQDDVRLAILSITAANTGLNLTAASLVVFSELFWNPGILTQAEDRVHRIGQESSVVIHYLVSTNTADDFIWPLIQGKLDVLGKAGLSKDNFSDANTVVAQSAHRTQIQTGILDYFKEHTGDILTEDGDIVSSDSGPRQPLAKSSEVVDDFGDDWDDDDDDDLESSMVKVLDAVESSSTATSSQEHSLSGRSECVSTPTRTKLPGAENMSSSLWSSAGTSMSRAGQTLLSVNSRDKTNNNNSVKGKEITKGKVESKNAIDDSFDWLDTIDDDFMEAAESPAVKKRKLVNS